MKTSKKIKLCTITILEIALFQPAVANSPIPNYADDNDDCIRALYQITTQAEKSCGDISDNDIKVLRSACFCAPIQGNAPSGQCTNSVNDAELNINTQNHTAFFVLDAQECSERYIDNAPRFNITPNFCTNKMYNNDITKPNVDITNNAWLHKSSFKVVGSDGKTEEITMNSLRERLINTSCNRIIAIDDQTSLNDPYPYKLYVALNDDLILSQEIKLSDSNEPAIIFGKNITIKEKEEVYEKQKKLAHILASGTLKIDYGKEFIGGLNANKLNYTFTTNNTKQRIITSKDLTGGECRKCSEIQKAETNAFRLSQISGQNACEQIILQLEKCTSGNSECTPYKEKGVVVTITKDGTSTTNTTDENGRVYLSNSTYQSNFSASLRINNQATKVYCAATNTLSDSCNFSGNICKASINNVAGYVGETLPVEIKIPGDVRNSFKAYNDNTADSADTVIKVSANIATTQDVTIITNIDGKDREVSITPDTGTTTPKNGDIVLPNATISYDEHSNQTIIKSTLVVNTLALDREPKTTYFNSIKLEVQNKNPGTGETPEVFSFDFRQETTKPKIRTAPVAICLNVNNKNPDNPYLLESDRTYNWTQKAVGCTTDLCKTDTTPVDQNKNADQKTLRDLCAQNTISLPRDAYDDWQREGPMPP